MSGNDSNYSSCPLSLYDSGPYLCVAGVRVATGLTSLLCCLLLVIFFVYIKLKQQIVANQFLVFYLAISALLNSISYLLSRVNFHTERPLRDKYCLFAGPLALYTSSTDWMCVLCISCNLLAQVTCQPNGRKLHWLYFGLIFGLPVLWCWVPFVSHAYGTSGPWCGIRTFTEDCEQFQFGVVLQLILVALPVFILLTVTISLSVATWVLLKRKLRTLETTSYPQSTPIDKSQLLAELKLLLWFPPVYPVIQLPLLATVVYDTIQPFSPRLPLWYLQVLTSPLAGAAIALLITLSSETNTRARIRSWIALHCWHTEERERVKSSSKRHVSEYDCDLYMSYGDSIEGVQSKRRRERIRNSGQNRLPPENCTS